MNQKLNFIKAIDLILDQNIDIVSIASYDHYHYEQILYH